jgi:hypothetical protein
VGLEKLCKNFGLGFFGVYDYYSFVRIFVFAIYPLLIVVGCLVWGSLWGFVCCVRVSGFIAWILQVVVCGLGWGLVG